LIVFKIQSTVIYQPRNILTITSSITIINTPKLTSNHKSKTALLYPTLYRSL